MSACRSPRTVDVLDDDDERLAGGYWDRLLKLARLDDVRVAVATEGEQGGRSRSRRNPN